MPRSCADFEDGRSVRSPSLGPEDWITGDRQVADDLFVCRVKPTSANMNAASAQPKRNILGKRHTRGVERQGCHCDLGEYASGDLGEKRGERLADAIVREVDEGLHPLTDLAEMWRSLRTPMCFACSAFFEPSISGRRP